MSNAKQKQYLDNIISEIISIRRNPEGGNPKPTVGIPFREFSKILRLLREIKDKRLYTIRGYDNYLNFYKDNFPKLYKPSYIMLGWQVLDHPLVGPHAEELGMGKARYLITYDFLTVNDIELAKRLSVAKVKQEYGNNKEKDLEEDEFEKDGFDEIRSVIDSIKDQLDRLTDLIIRLK